jgi:O-antigen/teichoic acid export membrane protein
MSLSQRTIKAGTWQLTAVVTRAVLQLVVLAILARYVLPNEFGYIAMANMVMVFIDMFADAGIGPAIIQKKELTDNHINAGFFLSVILGMMFFSILWLGAPIIAGFFKADNLVSIVRWVGVSALITKLSSVSRARIERDMRFDILMWIDTSSYLFGYALVGIVIAVMGYGVWAIVAGKLVQCTLQTVCLLAIRPNPVKPVFSRNEYKELLTYGGGLTFARIFDNIASQGDYFVIGRFLGSTPLGFYDRASSIMAMPGQYLNLVLDKTLFPAMSQIQSQKKRLEKAYFLSTSIVSTLLIPITILMYLMAPEIIATLLGPNWSASILPFRILLITVIFRIFMNISDTLVRATGAVYASAARKAVLAFLIIFGSWIGHFWGLSGVAIAVDVAIFIGYTMMIQLSIKIIGCNLIDYLKIYKHGLMLGCILCLIMSPIVTLLRLYMNSQFLVLLTTLLCSSSLMIAIMMLFPRLLGESVRVFIDHSILGNIAIKKVRTIP